MAELSVGGTSMAARRSSARTRPRASGSGTTWGGATEVTCARIRAWPSCTEIMAKLYLCYDARAMLESSPGWGVPEVETAEPSVAPGVGARLAGFWLRAAAVAIDWAFTVGVQVALGALAGLLWGAALRGSRVFQAAGAPSSGSSRWSTR